MSVITTEEVYQTVGKSNSVIILLSQKFIESSSCLEMYGICRKENEQDPSFKIIIVMTKPREFLQNVPKSLQKYLKSGISLEQHKENFWKDLSTNIHAVKTLHLVRGHDYAAFLSYYSSHPTKADNFPIVDDEKYVKENILARFDETCGGRYKLCHHRVDFLGGIPIMDNIRGAVRCSKCAIIVLSQNFVNSDWCCEEFEMCMAKTCIDPTYMCVILMQPIETLKNLTAHMEKFFRNYTYLEKDDKDLWMKLERHLAHHASISS